jgi:hypothetical protein
MELIMGKEWILAIILLFGAISAFGQNEQIGPNGEGSFIAGPLGLPASVLNEGGSWTRPLLIYKNSEIEIFIPDIRNPSWAAWFAEDFRDNGTYSTFLYLYGRKSHRTIRELVSVFTRTKMALVVSNIFSPPDLVDLSKPDPSMPIDRITALVRQVVDNYHGSTAQDNLREQKYVVLRMAMCSGPGTPNPDCALSNFEFKRKHPIYNNSHPFKLIPDARPGVNCGIGTNRSCYANDPRNH